MNSRPNAVAVVIGFAMLCAIWGEFPITARLGTEGQPPFLVAGLRFLLASGILVMIVRLRGASLRLPPRYLGVLFLIAMAMIACPAAVFFWAVQHAETGVLTLTWSTAPLFICLLNARDAGEGQSLRSTIGMAAGFGGVVLVIAGGSGLATHGAALAGELAVAGSAFIYALGFQQVRTRAGAGDILVLTAWQLLFAGAAITALSLVVEQRGLAAPSAANAVAFAFLVVCASCITFSLTNWLVRQLGTVRTGYNSLITPGLTVLLAAPQLGEPLSARKLIGLALVVGGLLLVMPRTARAGHASPISRVRNMRGTIRP